jgi:ABC-type sugar transport system permease subunit
MMIMPDMSENSKNPVLDNIEEANLSAEKTDSEINPEITAAAATAAAKEANWGKRKPIRRARISYERKKRLYGYGFIALWFLGALYMFVVPVVQSVIYSLSNTQLTNSDNYMEYGMSRPGIYTEWNNFGAFNYVLTIDSEFITLLPEALLDIVIKVPVILVFSMFVAILLSQKFRGRTVARAIFFLPVLIATGPVISVINGDILSQGISSGDQFSTLFETDMVGQFLEFMGFYRMGETVITAVSDIASSILNYIWVSGIQILIFLAALQQIPTAAKEAASIEGATGWEFFWKISFPIISPMILANLIYTIIDTFIDYDNPVMKYVMTQFGGQNYNYASAMAWIYFVIVAIALAIIMGIASKFVFYQVD